MMWPDYSCCDFCPLDDSHCESCQARASERRLNEIMASLDLEDGDCSYGD